MIDAIEKHRDDLEALAEREDLVCQKYAEALLDAVESEG